MAAGGGGVDGSDVENGEVSGDAWAQEDQQKDIYTSLLVEDSHLRAKAIEEAIATLQQLAQETMRLGSDGLLSFAATHGPYIINYSRNCPFHDIATAFQSLLDWLQKTCLIELEKVLLDDAEEEASDEDLLPKSEVPRGSRIRKKRRHRVSRHDRTSSTDDSFSSSHQLHAPPGATPPSDNHVVSPPLSAVRHPREAPPSSNGGSDHRSEHPSEDRSKAKTTPDRQTPCSTFIPANDMEPLLSDRSEVQALYQHVFLRQGEVPNWIRALSIKPVLALKMYKAWSAVMSQGPLPPQLRWYIGMMCGSLHDCDYWVTHTEEAFLDSGGCQSWTTMGVEAVAKLHAFANFNTLLAYRPWQLNADSVSALVEGAGWTVPELTQAVVIAASANSLCSVTQGLGVVLEGMKPPETPATSSPSPTIQRRVYSTEDMTEACIMEALRGRAERGQPLSTSLEAFHQLVEADIQSMNSDDPKEVKPPPQNPTLSLRYQKISGNLEHTFYENFRLSSKRPPANPIPASDIYASLRLTEYNWSDDAHCIIDQFLSSDLAGMLEDEFTTVTTMTDNDIFGSVKGIDTTCLRRMVWLYVLRLYGIVADDMDYSEINSLVGIRSNGIMGLKRYIKFIGCQPTHITTDDYHFDVRYTQPFSTKDKVHICLLAAQARKQAILIYGMRAIAKYLSNK